jgi:hypothetical protein
MRQSSVCLALLGGIASLAGFSSTASAGCDCGPPVAYIAPYAVAPAYVAQPVVVAEPILVAQSIPQPIYVVNQGIYPYPYVHGYEFYGRPRHYGGRWHGWRHAHYVAPPPHPYGPLEK